jgi:hypothetical protein
MRFKQFYINEDARTDKLYRNIATRLAKRIKIYLDKVADGEEEPTITMVNYNGYGIPLGEIDKKYNDLIVILAQKGFKHGFASEGPLNKKAILLSYLQTPFQKKHINTSFPTKFFVHEFIHYMDFKRRKKEKISVSPARKAEAGKMKDYFNTPEEFNAYYQEGLANIDFFLDNKNVPLSAKMTVYKDFNSFQKFAMREFESDFIKNLTPANMKKLKRRLAKHYEEFKKRI